MENELRCEGAGEREAIAAGELLNSILRDVFKLCSGAKLRVPVSGTIKRDANLSPNPREYQENFARAVIRRPSIIEVWLLPDHRLL
jgi:hypothetical protein